MESTLSIRRQEEHLLLDPSIRNWVVMPMLALLLLVGIGRHYVQILIKSEPKASASDLDKEIRFKQTCGKASRLRIFGRFINDDAYQMRKMAMIRKKSGILREKVPGATNPMMSNPSSMVDMLKGNMVFMLPNIAMMTFVGYFFSGFVCLKFPFPMPSNRFKVMLQRGVDLTTLDVSYVSSLSWYFLLTFGLNGVYKLILGDNADFDDGTRMMQMQMGGMVGGGPQMFDAAAAYRFELDMLSITKADYIANRFERKLLGDRYPVSDNNDIDLSRLTETLSK